eukprot:4134100-Prymnesium_polylepis.1
MRSSAVMRAHRELNSGGLFGSIMSAQRAMVWTRTECAGGACGGARGDIQPGEQRILPIERESHLCDRNNVVGLPNEANPAVQIQSRVEVDLPSLESGAIAGTPGIPASVAAAASVTVRSWVRSRTAYHARLISCSWSMYADKQHVSQPHLADSRAVVEERPLHKTATQLSRNGRCTSQRPSSSAREHFCCW